MFYYPLSFPIVLTDLLLLSGREATRQTQQFSHFPGSFLQWCAEYPTVVFAWNLLAYNFNFYRSLFRSLWIFPFFILLPCSQTVELAEYHHQYIKHPTKVYIPLNLLMLFNEERSHLAADQSKNFPQSLTYNYYWIPRLVIVVIWPKCCAAFFLLLFFFFSFECNCSTSAAKRWWRTRRLYHQSRQAAFRWPHRGMVCSLKRVKEREKKKMRIRNCSGEARIENGGTTRLLRIRVE